MSVELLLRDGLERLSAGGPVAPARAERVHHRVAVVRRRQQAVAGVGAAVALSVTGLAGSRLLPDRGRQEVAALPAEQLFDGTVTASGGRVRVEPPGRGDRPGLSLAQARAAFGKVSDYAGELDAPDTEVLFGLFSDTVHGVVRRPVWAMVVTVQDAPGNGVPQFSPAPESTTKFTQTVLVVIDAQTGEFLTTVSEGQVQP